MNIGSGNKYPANALSNFTYHLFYIDNIQCNSMEGFLQSLKFNNLEIQKEVCLLIGLKAKYRGKHKKWWRTQKLYWLGKEIDRHSEEYQQLLDRVYQCMFEQSENFRNAFKASENAVLTHSIGKNDSHRTILTNQEFCSRLMKLRNEL
jgi:hypothetical protein